MITANLQDVAHAVVRRAQQQGSVTPEEVQQELHQAGVAEEMWEDVLELCRRSLRRRNDRYHYVPPRKPTAQDRLRALQRVVRGLIRHHRQAQRIERRGQDRIDFIQPVRVVTADQRTLHLLSRDLSTSGIRLIGARSLLGQKVRVFLGEGSEVSSLPVRILWTCAVGDDLYENGGMFLDSEDENG
jgi:hypothetical protein